MMKARLPVVLLGLVLAGLGALLALTLAAPAAAAALAAAIGLILGLVLGQALMWLRASTGRVTRVENRVDALRSSSTERHEGLVRALRHLRESAVSAEQDAKAAARSTRELTDVVVPAVRDALQGHEDAIKQHQSDMQELRLSIADEVDNQVVLLEDYMQLMRLVPMPLPMPRPGTWAASEDLLLWLAGYVLEHRPRLVVDLGSGQSSVWMAAAMRTAGYDGRVIGVDHDERFALATMDLARRQGVDAWLTVVHAPLREQDIDGRSVTWYDTDALADIEGIDLLSVDGPPGQGAAYARWPALPALRHRLSPDATIVLDDLIRRDERQIVADWMARYPGFALERLAFEKGAAVMRRQPEEQPEGVAAPSD